MINSKKREEKVRFSKKFVVGKRNGIYQGRTATLS